MPLLWGHLDFLDLRALLGSNTLELYCLALVLHLREGELEAELVIVLLVDVIESELDDDLSELGIGLAALDGHGVPDDIVDLCELTLLIVVFTDETQT